MKLSSVPSETTEHYTEAVEEAKNSLPRYQVYDGADTLLPRAPRKWVIEELVLERSLNLWVGKFGSKKTWSMLDAAVCAALGEEWVGYKTDPVNVMYFDQDMGIDNLMEYLGRTIRGHLGQNKIEGRLKFISGADFDLWKPEDVSAMYAEIVSRDIKLVFMDALRNFTPGRDENSVKEMQPTLNTLRQLVATTGAGFVVSHHENRAGEWSGSTAIPAGVDSVLSIKSEENARFIHFKTGKKRAGKPQEFAAEATWTEDQFYLTSADKDALKKPNALGLDVLNYFENNGNTSVTTLLDYFDRVGKTTFYKIIDGLVKEGKVERKNPEAPKRAGAIYGLVTMPVVQN